MQDWEVNSDPGIDIKSQVLGKVSAQDPQDQVLSTKEIYLPQRDKGQRIRDKDRRYKTRKKKEGQGRKGIFAL